MANVRMRTPLKREISHGKVLSLVRAKTYLFRANTYRLPKNDPNDTLKKRGDCERPKVSPVVQ